MTQQIIINQPPARTAQLVREFISGNPAYQYRNTTEKGGIRSIPVAINQREIGVVRIVPMQEQTYVCQVQFWPNPSNDANLFWKALSAYFEALPVLAQEFRQMESTDRIGEELARFIETMNRPTWDEPSKPYLSPDVFITVGENRVQFQLYKVYPADKYPSTPVAQIVCHNRTVVVECLLRDTTTVLFFEQLRHFISNLLQG